MLGLGQGEEETVAMEEEGEAWRGRFQLRKGLGGLLVAVVLSSFQAPSFLSNQTKV